MWVRPCGSSIKTGGSNNSSADHDQIAVGRDVCSVVAICGNNLAIVSAASGTAVISPDSLASAFGSGLAGASVVVTDSAGVSRSASFLYVSSSQVNFLAPAQTATGTATVTATNSAGIVSSGTVNVATVAPALFSANGNGAGVAAAIVVYVAPDGSQTSAPVFSCGSAPLSCVTAPLNLSGPGAAILELFGTGIRGRSALGAVTCLTGGIAAPVVYAGAQGGFSGLDQVNVMLPATLAGQPLINIVLTVDGQTTNAVTIAAAPASLTSADFFVAPGGNDQAAGTLDSPFASIARAQAAVRAIRKSNPNRALTVMLRGGTYYLPLSATGPGALNFTQDDSGTSAALVTWENYPGEVPVINGGIPVGSGGLGLAWTHVGDSLWQVQLPAAIPNFESLFYNGDRRLRARLSGATGVGYYMQGGVCLSTSSGQAVAMSECNLGSFFRIAAEIAPTGPNARCPTVTNASDTTQAKCLDRFTYDSKAPIAAWVNLNAAGSACGGTASAYPAGDVEITIFDPWTVDILRITASSAKGYPPKSRSASGCISLGRSLQMRLPSGLAMPSLSNSAAASLTRSPAPDKWGSMRGTRNVGVSTEGIQPHYIRQSTPLDQASCGSAPG